MEILVVAAIMIVLLSVTTPVVMGLRRAGDLQLACSETASLVDQGRSYAMAKACYVYIGVKAVPAGAGSPNAQVLVGLAASKEAERPYDLGAGGRIQANRIEQINRFSVFSNVHLTNDFGSPAAQNGLEERPTPDVLFSESSDSPVSLELTRKGEAIEFTKVLEVSPDGTVTLLGRGLSKWIEIGFQPVSGAALSPDEKNFAVLQIAGVTGATSIYRP